MVKTLKNFETIKMDCCFEAFGEGMGRGGEGVPSSKDMATQASRTSTLDLKRMYVTHHTSHVTHHTSHITRHTSHVTRHTSHITHHTSHVTRHTRPETKASVGLAQSYCALQHPDACEYITITIIITITTTTTTILPYSCARSTPVHCLSLLLIVPFITIRI